MESLLKNKDYKKVFKYFQEISQIPRCSGNEGGISNYLVSFAKDHNLKCEQDDAMNVILFKEPSQGYEDKPPIILQAHMDMVCEKSSESSHDFSKDKINLIVDGDFLRADGTTLGADNGIGLSYILSILSDKDLKHPRLEAIVTSDEEVGMVGAKALDTSSLKGKFMINLDSGEEGYLLSSCAGGLTGTTTIPIKRVLEKGSKVKIKIKDLQGGHSGVEIHENRSNANKLMGRLLFEIKDTLSFSLIGMQGGFKDNVIPREAEVEVFIAQGDNLDKVDEFINRAQELMEVYKKELSASEPNLDYEIINQGPGNYKPLNTASLGKVINLLINTPYGVQVNSSVVEGLVESSLNLGMVNLEEEQAVFCNSIRSSVESYKHFLSKKLEYMANFLGGTYIVRGEYPAWEYKEDSKMRNHLAYKFKELYEKEMIIEAIHAGLECGIISKKIPGIDIVSIGPDMYDIHTTEERVSVSSTIRVYKFLEQVIQEKLK